MKRFLLAIMLLLLISPVFAKTVQCVKRYQVNDGYRCTIDVTPQINYMLNAGWKVVSITPITMWIDRANPTDYVIVVYEKEE